MPARTLQHRIKITIKVLRVLRMKKRKVSRLSLTCCLTRSLTIFFVWSCLSSNWSPESTSSGVKSWKSSSETITWLPELAEGSWTSTRWSPLRPRSNACRSACKWKRNNRRSKRPWSKFLAKRRHPKKSSINLSETQAAAKSLSKLSWMPLSRVRGVIGSAARSKSANSPISSFRRNSLVWTESHPDRRLKWWKQTQRAQSYLSW